MDGVEKLNMQFDALEEIKSECRFRMAGERSRADALASDNKITDQVAATEVKILTVLEVVSKRLDSHNAVIAGLMDQGAGKVQKVKSGGDETVEKWTEVLKRVTKTKKPAMSSQPIAKATVAPRIKTLPRAVVIKRGESSFSDTVKNIRTKVNVEAIGDSISKMSETRNGNVLIEILGGNEAAEVVKKKIEKALGPGESVRSLEQRSLIQLRDLDCVTTKEDVSEAIRRETGMTPDDVKVLTIRHVFREYKQQ